jgi:TatD DNase family protein
MRLFDTHAHLLDGRFDEERDELIERMPGEGIVGVIEAGCCEEVSAAAVELAERVGYIYAAVGIHPHDSEDVSENYLGLLESLAQSCKTIAIGEIGLDYYYDNSPRDIQRKVFRQQIELAQKLDLPMVYHMRKATADFLEILKDYDGLKGVVHCYSGSAETAHELIKMGLHISFTGSVTFKNAKKVVEAAQAVPLERLMAETDSPYLSPEPVRGRRNDPRNVEHVIRKLAEIKEISFEKMCEINIDNVKGLYGI